VGWIICGLLLIWEWYLISHFDLLMKLVSKVGTGSIGGLWKQVSSYSCYRFGTLKSLK
jgi:hypothetical protein